MLITDLATSLSRPTDGGLKYTFQLRSRLRYSTGEPVRGGPGESAASCLAMWRAILVQTAVAGTDACATEDGAPGRPMRPVGGCHRR